MQDLCAMHRESQLLNVYALITLPQTRKITLYTHTVHFLQQPVVPGGPGQHMASQLLFSLPIDGKTIHAQTKSKKYRIVFI